MKKKRISILGSTGSIGVSALDVVRQHRDKFEVVALAAGSNVELLARQIEEFSPRIISVKSGELADELKAVCNRPIEVLWGGEGAVRVATVAGTDMVLSAMVGSVGLQPTYEAICAGKTIALANKETLVAAGELMMSAAKTHGVKILPVDSEHSAIFQSIEGHRQSDVRKIILTASGGPFWNSDVDLSAVTVEEALKHPNWSMGPKITIDSATMMNKCLEIIEAHWLFGLPEEGIDVVIHPQSIVHSMVEYKDGSVIAQMGRPDMRGPISYALAYPERISNNVGTVDWPELGQLTFFRPDAKRFPVMNLARQAIRVGGSMSAVMNAANEVAVQAFLDKQIGFLDIYRVVSTVMENHVPRKLRSIEEVLDVDRETRILTQEKI